MEHALNVNVAIQFDTDTALFLQNIKHWTLKNLANKNNIHDGLCWSYDTLEAMADIFPYWSKKQLERVINNCVKFGLIVKGNYNKTPYDRTCWYAMTPKAYWFFPELCAEKYLELLFSAISPNGEIKYSDWRNQFPIIATPIPYTKPDTDPDTKNKPKSKKVKQDCLTVDEMSQTNPHEIPVELLEEWKKSRKKPITKRVMTSFNKELSLIAADGIKPIDAVNKMLDKQWSTVEYRFFLQDIQYLQAKSSLRTRPATSKPVYDDNDTSWIEGVFA